MAVPKKNKKQANSAATNVRGRHLSRPRFSSLKLRRQVKRSHKPIPGGWRLFWGALKHLWKYRRLFVGIVLIYLLLTLLLVKGLASTNLSELKANVESVFQDQNSTFGTTLTLFGYLLTSSNTARTPLGGTVQTFLLLVVSLAVIWMLRQTYAAGPARVRDAFYKGMYPLVPFVLVVLVIGLQLIPLGIANFLYSLLFSQGIAVTVLEKMAGAGVLLVLALLSFYMLTSSLLALYMVTLPDMTPLKALRSARELVHFRRWLIMRRLLFLPFILLIIIAIIILPLIIFVTPAAEWVFLLLAMSGLVVIHSYIYRLYRELI